MLSLVRGAVGHGVAEVLFHVDGASSRGDGGMVLREASIARCALAFHRRARLFHSWVADRVWLGFAKFSFDGGGAACFAEEDRFILAAFGAGCALAFLRAARFFEGRGAHAVLRGAKFSFFGGVAACFGEDGGVCLAAGGAGRALVLLGAARLLDRKGARAVRLGLAELSFDGGGAASFAEDDRVCLAAGGAGCALAFLWAARLLDGRAAHTVWRWRRWTSLAEGCFFAGLFKVCQ